MELFKKGGSDMNYFISCITAILAGVMEHFIIKWLEKHEKK